MVRIILEFLLFFGICFVVFDAGYKKGRGDLWNMLSKGYIVLPKGSYYCSDVGVKKNDK